MVISLLKRFYSAAENGSLEVLTHQPFSQQLLHELTQGL
jgi:hypothetical protein